MTEIPFRGLTGPHSHVIPVDPSLTTDAAWHEICLMGVRSTYTGTEAWASVDCNGECRNVNRDNVKRYHNDVLVEAWVDGRRVFP